MTPPTHGNLGAMDKPLSGRLTPRKLKAAAAACTTQTYTAGRCAPVVPLVGKPRPHGHQTRNAADARKPSDDMHDMPGGLRQRSARSTQEADVAQATAIRHPSPVLRTTGAQAVAPRDIASYLMHSARPGTDVPLGTVLRSVMQNDTIKRGGSQSESTTTCTDGKGDDNAISDVLDGSESGHSTGSTFMPFAPAEAPPPARRPQSRQSELARCRNAGIGVGRNDAVAPQTNELAEKWLRLARITLLTIPNMRTREADESEDDIFATSTGPRSGIACLHAMGATPMKRSSSPKHDAERDCEQQEDGTECEADDGVDPATFWERFPKKYRNGHLCLGDVMNESISWLEPGVDSEPCSPKASPEKSEPVDNGEEGAEPQCGEYMRQMMRALAYQQKAPGIVGGMPKNLSC